jgi:hypothetical protein
VQQQTRASVEAHIKVTQRSRLDEPQLGISEGKATGSIALCFTHGGLLGAMGEYCSRRQAKHGRCIQRASMHSCYTAAPYTLHSHNEQGNMPQHASTTCSSRRHRQQNKSDAPLRTPVPGSPYHLALQKHVSATLGTSFPPHGTNSTR